MSIEIKLRQSWHSIHYLFDTTFIRTLSATNIALRRFFETVYSFYKASCFPIIVKFFTCFLYYQIEVLAWCKIALAKIVWSIATSGIWVAFLSICCMIRLWRAGADIWVFVVWATLVGIVATSIVILIFLFFTFL